MHCHVFQTVMAIAAVKLYPGNGTLLLCAGVSQRQAGSRRSQSVGRSAEPVETAQGYEGHGQHLARRRLKFAALLAVWRGRL